MPATIGEYSAFGHRPAEDRQEAGIQVLPARVLGDSARRALERASVWQVFAVFRRSVYCASGGGNLVCLGPPALGPGPLNILVNLPDHPSRTDHGVHPGATVEYDGAVLHLAPRMAISCAGADVWRPAALRLPRDRAALARSLEALAVRVTRLAHGDGMAPLIPSLLVGAPLHAFGRGPASALARIAWPPVVSLRCWLESTMFSGSPPASPPPSIERLIGLGPGLTPSGDDLLGGALIALRALGWLRVADTLTGWLLPRARLRTHPISYAHLACAAEGEGAAALHDTLSALCSPDGPVARPLATLGSIGYSSGWDALAGAALVTRLHATARASGAVGPAGADLPTPLKRVRSATGVRHADTN